MIIFLLCCLCTTKFVEIEYAGGKMYFCMFQV